MHPLGGVLDHAGAYHVQIDIDEAAMQVLVSLDRRGVVTVLPESAPAPLALIVFLPCAPGDELHAPGNHSFAGVRQQEMNVIGRYHVVEQA
jgi:hypothetical protein